VPTEAGLSLFDVLKQADPALVDPGVTAQLECLLDDVVVGKQEMVGAIDAVCSVAERIIGKLKEGAAASGPPLLGAAVGNGPGTLPPTPAMKRYAGSLARQKGIKPPPGYKTSISICRKFLNEHASKKAEGETPGKLDSKPVSPAQMVYAKKIAQGKGVVIPEQAKANSAAMSAWIDSNRGTKRKSCHDLFSEVSDGRSLARSRQSNGLKLWPNQSVLFRHPTNANSIAWQHLPKVLISQPISNRQGCCTSHQNSGLAYRTCLAQQRLVNHVR
jgi:hypothetical protein